MRFNFEAVLDTVRDPDFIVRSRTSIDVHLYHKAITELRIGPRQRVTRPGYMVVVVNVYRSLVLTAFARKKRKLGLTLWQR